VLQRAVKINHASHLSNNELVVELTRLARGEREATVALIVHLAEFDVRQLYRGAGFQSLFQYCVEVLRLSEDAACNRIESERTARRYPAVLDMLLRGELSPTTLRMLARWLTDENHEGLLAAAKGKTKRQVEELLAGRFPQAGVPDSIRKVSSPNAMPIPVATVAATATAASGSSDGGGDQARVVNPPSIGSSAQVPAPSSVPPPSLALVRPTTADRYEIRFTASAETREKLQLAQDLLGHAVPSGDLAEVFDRALNLLVEDLARKKFAATERPGKSRGQSDDSRNIPAAVKRKVWIRDGGRCTFVSLDGHRCGARRFVEFHHSDPYGAGGKPTVDKIRLMCGVHNRYEAELFYGPGQALRRHRCRQGTDGRLRVSPRPRYPSRNG
jgi:hypothetical protein